MFRKQGTCKFDYKGAWEFNLFNCLIPRIAGADYVTVTCYVKEITPNDSPSRKLADDYYGLYKSSMLSDFAIKVGDTKFNVHRNILSARSEKFGAMLTGVNTESDFGYVEIIDIDADTVEDIICYLYSGKVPDFSTKSAENLLIAADEYCLEELKNICEQRMTSEINKDNALALHSLADKYNCRSLKKEVIGFICRNIAQISETEEYKKLDQNSVNAPTVRLLVDIVAARHQTPTAENPFHLLNHQ